MLATAAYPESTLRDDGPSNSHLHAISWSSVIAGAFVTSALGLILLTLGFGLGLSSVSPWAYRGVSGKTIAEGAIAWLVLSQIIAGGMGGYLSGRLRHRWMRVHAHEVYFRDSAQGFLAWAVAVVVTAGFLASAGTAMMGMSPSATPYRAHARVSAPVAPMAPSSDASAAVTSSPGEMTSSEDQTIEVERKAAAYGALWLFIALLAGAFSSAMFGTVGGRHRDTLFVYAA